MAKEIVSETRVDASKRSEQAGNRIADAGRTSVQSSFEDIALSILVDPTPSRRVSKPKPIATQLAEIADRIPVLRQERLEINSNFAALRRQRDELRDLRQRPMQRFWESVFRNVKDRRDRNEAELEQLVTARYREWYDVRVAVEGAEIRLFELRIAQQFPCPECSGGRRTIVYEVGHASNADDFCDACDGCGIDKSFLDDAAFCVDLNCESPEFRSAFSLYGDLKELRLARASRARNATRSWTTGGAYAHSFGDGYWSDGDYSPGLLA